MSSPVGFAPRTGPPQGLAYCGESISGGAPNWIGGASDDPVTEIGGGYFYLRPDPAGVILVDDGPACSDVPMQATDNLGGKWDYGQVEMPPQTGTATATGSTATAAGIAAGAACEFVTVEFTISIGLTPGNVKCSASEQAPFSIEAFHLTMSGAEYDALQAPQDQAPAWPQATYTPIDWTALPVDNSGYLLRASAHTWPGQDPDNQYNRALWHPAEVGAVAWSLTYIAFSATVYFTAAVYGYQTETDYPTPCPIIPGSGPATPSTIAAGNQATGLLAVENILGVAQ